MAKVLLEVISTENELPTEKEVAPRKQVEIPVDIIGTLLEVTILTLDGEKEKATKLFRKGSDEYIIVTGSVMDNLKKLCPTTISQLEG